MKRILLILLAAGMLQSAMAQAQIEKLFGSDATPLDTVTIAQGDTVLSRLILFKNPHKIDGMLYIAGYATKLSGTADSIYVDFRMLNERYPQYLYDDWQTNVATIVPGDSANYRVSVDLQDWWAYCDGYQVRFRAGSGAFSYRLYAKGYSR